MRRSTHFFTQIGWKSLYFQLVMAGFLVGAAPAYPAGEIVQLNSTVRRMLNALETMESPQAGPDAYREAANQYYALANQLTSPAAAEQELILQWMLQRIRAGKLTRYDFFMNDFIPAETLASYGKLSAYMAERPPVVELIQDILNLNVTVPSPVRYRLALMLRASSPELAFKTLKDLTFNGDDQWEFADKVFAQFDLTVFPFSNKDSQRSVFILVSPPLSEILIEENMGSILQFIQRHVGNNPSYYQMDKDFIEELMGQAKPRKELAEAYESVRETIDSCALKLAPRAHANDNGELP